LNTQPKELSTATLQISAQPAVPQGHHYTYKFYALHTNHLPTFLKGLRQIPWVGILPIIHQSFSCYSTTTIIHNAHAPPPHCHLHLFDTATHNAHHPPRWSPTTITRWPTWQCHITNRTNGHIDAREQWQEPELPRRSWWRGCQTMDNDEVSPPPPYCLLTLEPGATSAMWQLGSEWSSFIVWFQPNPTQQRWMDGNDDDDDNAMQRQGVDTNGYEGPPPPTKMMAHHHPLAPPHKHQQWPSTTPPTRTMAQHHPTNSKHSPAPPHEPAPMNNDNGPLSAPTDPLWTTNTAHHDPLPMANTAHHNPIPMAKTTHDLPLPTVTTAQHQHPRGAPHPTNGEHHPPPPTIFDDSPPPAPTNCEDGPAPHANGDDSAAQINVIYVS